MVKDICATIISELYVAERTSVYKQFFDKCFQPKVGGGSLSISLFKPTRIHYASCILNDLKINQFITEYWFRPKLFCVYYHHAHTQNTWCNCAQLLLFIRVLQYIPIFVQAFNIKTHPQLLYLKFLGLPCAFHTPICIIMILPLCCVCSRYIYISRGLLIVVFLGGKNLGASGLTPNPGN